MPDNQLEAFKQQHCNLYGHIPKGQAYALHSNTSLLNCHRYSTAVATSQLLCATPICDLSQG
eukprot:1149305-Pelagomonas_calceolata.AAC.2